MNFAKLRSDTGQRTLWVALAVVQAGVLEEEAVAAQHDKIPFFKKKKRGRFDLTTY